MLRELITWVLNNYLGKYVGNLNTAQLTIALLSGEVELENLPLRRDALRNLGLPLQALSGSVGKIKLQVPVRQFKTAPWSICIEKVYMVIGPVNLNEWDAEAEEQADLDFKLSKLDGLEAQWRAQRENPVEEEYYASSYSGWLSYGTSLVTNIVENLQLKINDVHIRYEDSITVPDHRFACGITIDSLSASSCDSNWISGFTTNWNQNTAAFKLVELQSLSFYWDPLSNNETFGDVISSELADSIIKNKSQWSHQYIVSPVSAQARLKRDRSETPLRTRSRPRLVCDLIWNEVSLSLIDWQYNQMVQCIKGLDDISKNRRFRLLRPKQTIKENPKLWWIYAIRCHGLLITTNYFNRDIGEENNLYIEIYKRIFQNPNETISYNDKEMKDKVEKHRRYDEIVKLREFAVQSVPITDTKINNTHQGRGMLSQWFPQWWYNNSNTLITTDTVTTNHVINTQTITKDQTQLEDAILNALAQDNHESSNSVLKRDAVFGQFDLMLKRGTLNICTGSPSSKGVSMIHLQFENLNLNIESRPRSGSHFIGLSLGSVLLKDRITQNTEFPDLIKPQNLDDQIPRTRLQTQRSRNTTGTSSQSNSQNSEPLFLLHYEQKPLSYNTDYRLLIKSQSLDVVYNTDVLKWIIDFISKPHQISAARRKIEAMKNKTKMELIKNWENILDCDVTQRKTWTLEIDISAPQIMFVENLTSKNGCVVVVDFGKLQLTNGYLQNLRKKKIEEEFSELSHKDSEDDEAFVTPCSTPPVSETDSPTLCSAISDLPEIRDSIDESLSEGALRDKLYDRYKLDLTDLQVLVCKGKERWSFASAKGTSTLHVLDRFNISLQVERRVLNTADPQFPSLTLSGTLPKLVAHVNEPKITAILNVFKLLTKNEIQSPYKSPTEDSVQISEKVQLTVPLTEQENHREITKLIVLQFSIDQMALEVQSRGRSIAELQVTGVKAGFSKRPADTSITLSVHGLLLVDAIQSFGPDFELLVASHRHVGIDSVSGSLKQSEPCSPCSPASPDPLQDRPTSPHTISRALNNLQRATSPVWPFTGDLDALITVEVLLISPEEDGEKLQVANIQFNNLDIIANQETIVELIGFANRVFPKRKISQAILPPTTKLLNEKSLEIELIRTEITFDFHRLNVLILRALLRDTYLVGRKVGTFTMSEARIHATLGTAITVEGSLGGLQVLDLTPEGVNHQRIFSVGKDPLTETTNLAQDLLSSLTQEIYSIGQQKNDTIEDRQALSFCVSRDLNTCVNIKIRMASVWYTHCARFVQELSWCASEFKQYIKNLAKSIREKATDMAIGLVQVRTDIIGTHHISSPIKRNHRNSMLKTYNNSKNVIIKLDIILDTPVLVLPRSSCSHQVFVAHLGKITVSNDQTELCDIESNMRSSKNSIFTINEANCNYKIDKSFNNENIHFFDESIELSFENTEEKLDTYVVDIRNMNLYSLDTSKRKGFRLSALPRAEDFYSCQEDAIAVVYDTAIRLEITRIMDNSYENLIQNFTENNETLMISGSVIKPLELSLSRKQFEQLIETSENIFKVPTDLVKPPSDVIIKPVETVENSDFSTFELNNKFNQEILREKNDRLEPKVLFELPMFVIQLKNEENNPLIEMSFRDFIVNYEQNNQYETNIQISLRSILMEDLLRPPDSKHRSMVVSSPPDSIQIRPGSAFSSHSCPNLVGLHRSEDGPTGSLPDNLERNNGFMLLQAANAHRLLCPETPPPSPQPRTRQDNLVIYSLLLVNPKCPTFDTQYNSLSQSSSIDFNSLDLIVSVQSWLVLLNFFGLLSEDDLDTNTSVEISKTVEEQDFRKGNSELEISVRSLTLVIIKMDDEIAKANVSNAHFIVSKRGVAKTVEGRLGLISLSDLTPHGTIYREKFVTSGREALNFTYFRDSARLTQRSLEADAKLKIQMSSVRYVHTKRFVAEIQEFFREFSQLQTPVMKKIKPSDSRQSFMHRPTQLELEINAGSPIILLPMSSKSNEIIVADLGEFSLKNSFLFANEQNIVSLKKDIEGSNEILDVMIVHLVNTDLFTGSRYAKTDSLQNKNSDLCLDMGSYLVLKKGQSLLNNKCHLKLQVERNMDSWSSHNVPDFSVHGTLSRLEAVLNLSQYKLVRGFLSNNLGELIDDLYEKATNYTDSIINLSLENEKFVDQQIWVNSSITLDLQDVSVKLQNPNLIETNNINKCDYSFLACINFIKSSLKIDSFSDGSQDIDLVSQEILIKDSRFSDDSKLVQKNVFLNILQPINVEPNTNSVQAEVHSRRRKEQLKYTILLNNMRVMAILDWLECVRDFLSLSEENAPIVSIQKSNEINRASQKQLEIPQLELILNITDSELVFVEKTNERDTNAVILKSTTVLSYRPNETDRVFSINLNHLEVFSCLLGSEENTALSIIDPVTVNLDVKKGVLDIQLQKQLCIRLSYNDVRMFIRMMKSLPKQTKNAKNIKELEKLNNETVMKLTALGFSNTDCIKALEKSDNDISEAAIWLTQNAQPVRLSLENPLNITAIELQGNCISICVIDDCKDADVPLLEFSLSNLNIRQDIGYRNIESIFKVGYVKGIFASDYFDRGLSGWEPLIEPWKCSAEWNFSLSQGGQLNRLHLKLMSDDQLKLNITTTIIELFQLVKDNWVQDYYGNTTGNNNTQKQFTNITNEYKRRIAFVPFALKNETGVKLWFTPLVNSSGTLSRTNMMPFQESQWASVEPDTIIPFSFGPPKKLRHHDTHKLNLHQIGIRVEGWTEVGPVSIDRVGIYFRHAQYAENLSEMPRSRIVFAVTLEGSAQKLITVRSALRINNQLDNPIFLKMEHLFGHLRIRNWCESITKLIEPNDCFSIPLSHVHSFLFIKPITTTIVLDKENQNSIKTDGTNFNGNDYWKKYESNDTKLFNSTNIYQFCDRSIHWKDVNDNVDLLQELRTCHSNRNKGYHVVIALKKECYPSRENIPGHTITFHPPLKLINLLPCDLLYMLKSGVQGRISSSETANIHEIDLEENSLELNITLDSYPGAGKISISTGFVGFIETDVRLTDVHKRLLNLKANIQIAKDNGIQIFISAPFWLINRTGLPLVFRQDGVSYESSGQFIENEQARLISPLMFSFSDPDASRGLIVRLGKRYGINPPWCQPFNLHKDILHRQLRAGNSIETFVIGIEVRRGRGRYSRTSVVTFSPRYQLYNRSSYKLQFAQKCLATLTGDFQSKSTFIDAIPGCHLPFHWPKLEQEQEICVRLPEIRDCLWSGSVPIHEAQSFYINIRNINGEMNFLRLEIVFQGATYFLLFGNAQVLPPPIRIDNYSEVSIKFYQPDQKQNSDSRSKTTNVKPHSSIAYALDEPNGPKILRFEAPGNVVQTYSLRELGTMVHNLTYENFIYIAFSGTFKCFSSSEIQTKGNDFDMDSQKLVLGVVENRVVLVRKQLGDRSQLWRMNNEKQLEHEGSSPPREYGKGSVTRYVLDLEKPPQPMNYINLVIRPGNKQRRSTQTWNFTEDGRLMCEHSNMCVQARGGFFGLRAGSDAVLGMIVSDTHVITKSLVPIEQSIERQKLRPGSGVLSVSITMDGPVKIIQIKDVKSINYQPLTLDPTWHHASHIQNSHSNSTDRRKQTEEFEKNSGEFHINLKLPRGLGISIISRRPCEELAFTTLENITAEMISTPAVRSLDLSIGDMQIDNQLFETLCPVTLFTIKTPLSESPTKHRLPAIQLNVKMLPGPNKNAVIFEHLVLSLRPMSVYLEERLILRLAAFIGLGKSLQSNNKQLQDESDFEAQRVATKVLAANATRYYFGDLQISPSQIRLSVITASKISPHLGEIKKSLGLTLIKFEDALIEFKQFTYKHHFETLEVYLRAVKTQYKRELKWQAASILGSVDFLGNPLGFANDLSEGVSGLLFEGSVKSLVKNVTHGISNSTAKLTETLSDGLGRVVLDEQDTETRQRILEVPSGANSTGDHLVAGLKGFGFGLLGGVTSIVKHTYVGAQTDGIQGFISGFGKGLVGTVTKPVIGVLDLASETANAVRETSKSSNRILPERKRLPRCVTGATGGLLPPFSNTQSKGQQHLFLINKRDFTEHLLAYEPCLFQGDDSKLRLLVSSENVYIFSRSDDTTTIIFSYHLSELVSCHPVSVIEPRSKKLQHYIELCLTKKTLTTPGQELVKRPRVRCQTEEMSEKTSRQINYAKGIYDERKQTCNSDSVIE